MYRNYVEHVKSKPPHHRRQHAAQVAGLLTALAVFMWLATLGLRFGAPSHPSNSVEVTSADQTLLAGSAASVSDSSGIEVVGGNTQTQFSNY